jgi:lipopolysaccharide export system protein LptA
MKKPILRAFILLALTGNTSLTWADKADRSKPMNIEADSLRYDDVKQISVFSGKVVLTKGSITIRGAQIEVRQDPEGYQYGVVTGSADARAFFRQKRDSVEEFMEGEGDTIEYDGKADTVRFVQKAQLRRLRGTVVADEITGGVIIYDNLTDRFTVDGNSGKGASGAPTGRVRAMLSPKPESAASSAVPAPSAPATLRTTTTLGGTPK